MTISVKIYITVTFNTKIDLIKLTSFDFNVKFDPIGKNEPIKIKIDFIFRKRTSI